MNNTISSTTDSLEIKIPIEDLDYDVNKQYGIGIELNNNSVNILALEEFWLEDIPKGGDGTWHYYSTLIY